LEIAENHVVFERSLLGDGLRSAGSSRGAAADTRDGVRRGDATAPVADAAFIVEDGRFTAAATSCITPVISKNRLFGNSYIDGGKSMCGNDDGASAK